MNDIKEVRFHLRLEVKGKGTVFVIAIDETLRKGQVVRIKDKLWEIRNIECFTDGDKIIGSNMGLVVREYKG